MENNNVDPIGEPTAQMNENAQRARERSERTVNERADDFDGTVSTDDFDVDAVLSDL
jgi:hypothetical protein